jgi:pSer/pThr/pTyr-binding forkhead associated (FHA) protein
VGLLTVGLGAESTTLAVQPERLRDGVLVGRSERCDLVVPDAYTSRVHAVVVGIDGVPYLVDTGSGNGVRHVSGAPARCWRLEDADAFRLGNATVSWRRVQ